MARQNFFSGGGDWGMLGIVEERSLLGVKKLECQSIQNMRAIYHLSYLICSRHILLNLSQSLIKFLT